MLGRTAGAALLRAYGARRIAGLRVAIADPTVSMSEVELAISNAMETLRSLDERRWRRVIRYVRHVIIWAGDYTAYDSFGGIHLSSSHLREWAWKYLASALVHEATHLRLEALGLGDDPKKRSRIEAICAEEQADFLDRLPGAGPEVAAAVRKALETPWWTPAERDERVERNLGRAGIPYWIRRAVMVLKR